MAYETLLTERRGDVDGILWITLNRPERLNALNAQLFGELFNCFSETRKDRSVRCVVITGAGRGFCAGADAAPRAAALDAAQTQTAEAPPQRDPEGERLRFLQQREAFVMMRRLEIPVIASVNGVCVGAGFDMVCHCDMAVVSTAARFQVAYVKRGLFADLGGFWSIPKMIGERRAFEMMTTGRFMSAEEAHEAGLSNYLVSPEELEAKTMELAREVEAGPPIAQKLGKMLMRQTARLDFEAALDFSSTALGVLGPSDDRMEGIRSFGEKRAPKFTGR